MIHKTTRSILSVLLAVLLLVTSIPLTPAFAGGGGVSLPSESGEGRALEGEGTAGNPYKIATADDLREFAKLVNGTDGNSADPGAHAKLMNNIDLEGSETNQWTPIGNSINQYRGTFNGDGHTISGLYIKNTSSDTDYQGLFGYVSGSGKVQNLTVSGSVSGHLYVGGVVGRNLGNVINCTFSGSVSGNNYVGGVVGYNGGSVTNSYNTGSVSGVGSVGGVVGYNRVTVKNCYNTGAVNSSSDSPVGGVVGYNDEGRVTNCYNTGTVTGSGDRSNVGGVVGNNDGTVTGCYFLSSTAASGIGNKEDAEGAKSLTADQFKKQKSFTSWDFGSTDTWTIHPVLGRPVLNENKEGGNGSPDSPYEISTADQLKTFRDLVNGPDGNPNAHAVLMENITLNSNEEWEPIGNSESTAYTGTFNGQNFKISGLYINRSADYRGLFGRVNGGTVQDLSVSGDINGKRYVGGVVGLNRGSVEDCDFTGSVSGSDHVGGVVGSSSGGISASASVTNCYNTGSVSGSDYVGGVVGQNFGGPVENCYNTGTGTVTGTGNYVGGVVGQNLGGTVENCYNTDSITVTGSGGRVGGVVGDNGGNVENCYNTGTVNVSGNSSAVGGVVGCNQGGSVQNCYNTGGVNVTGTGNWVGGVVGWNSSDANVTNCYNTGSVSGSYVGGVVGDNDSTVENCYFLKPADVNKDLQGIGFGGEGEEAIQKTADAFHSGEVAYLLEQNISDDKKPVWGQSKLNTPDSLPTLVALDKANAQKVYQVTFDYGTSFADNDGRYAYSYTNGVVSEPTKNPELAGHTLSGWYSDPSLTTAWTFNTEISNDTTLYAKWIEATPEPTPEPEPEEPPYTGKYSYEVFTSVGDNGAISVDRYATEGDKVTIDVTPDQAYKLDELVVTANGKDVELTANGDGTYTFTMPSADVRITASFAEDPDWTEPEEPSTDVSDLFIDIAPDAWYKDAVQYAYDNGLMTGVSDTEFAPEATTTRAMIVSILARLEGVESAQAAGFADVDDNDWYATAVNWAANVGVVNGYEDNTFRPNTAITREQLAAILMNYAAYKGEDVSNRADLTSYTDQPSTWAEEAMSWAVAEGLISGVTNDQLQPQGNATRAQVAAILQRFLEA